MTKYILWVLNAFAARNFMSLLLCWRSLHNLNLLNIQVMQDSIEIYICIKSFPLFFKKEITAYCCIKKYLILVGNIILSFYQSKRVINFQSNEMFKNIMCLLMGVCIFLMDLAHNFRGIESIIFMRLLLSPCISKFHLCSNWLVFIENTDVFILA